MPAAYHLLGSLQIPRGMIWVDEFDWASVDRSSEYGLTGALVLDAAVKTNGRPITLQGVDDQGHILRSAVQSLYAMAATPLASYPLVLADGQSFTVQFAPGDSPVKAYPIGRPEAPGASYRYVATVRLVTV
jgi:hypothetical protein